MHLNTLSFINEVITVLKYASELIIQVKCCRGDYP